jgi:hypothetical protein
VFFSGICLANWRDVRQAKQHDFAPKDKQLDTLAQYFAISHSFFMEWPIPQALILTQAL